ncbi:unnamed protein product [Bursaphelenchus okinawaensis]|uniref:Complex 1 LYR protein domain-containing protein n=1 Tax=Bursaphelenchus okinawaensis TaxID=465554 RepID=A0A811JQ41_9BILA|nr:unnamed protein product [Bursaphelenchus okinawaensis]CAG9077644.1 unnamed protein product [Bursaphelenchus okinawaensis]
MKTEGNADENQYLMQRIRVLRLFKQILRTGRTWEAKEAEKTSEQKVYIRNEAFKRFRENKNVSNSEEIEKLIEEGEKRLEIGKHYKLPYERPAYLHPGASFDVHVQNKQFRIRSGAASKLPFGGGKRNPFISLPVDDLDVLFGNYEIRQKFPLKASFERRFLKLLSDKLAKHNVYSDGVFAALAGAMQNTFETFHRMFLHPKLQSPLIIEEKNQAISQGTTGLSTWGAAYLLSNYLIQTSEVTSNLNKDHPLKVLELGAGCGLAGLSLAKAFMSIQLTTTDCDMNVLVQLRKNVLLNFGEEQRVKVAELDWFKSEKNEVLKEEFDVVIAADVIYDPEILEAFLNTVTLILKRNSNSRAIVAFKERNPDTLQMFMERLDSSTLEIELFVETKAETPFSTVLNYKDGTSVAIDNVIPPDSCLDNFRILKLKIN